MKPTPSELARERHKLLKQARAILDKADSEKRGLRSEEDRQFEALLSDAREQGLTIEELRDNNLDIVLAAGSGRQARLERADRGDESTATVNPDELRFVRHDERLSEVYPCEDRDMQAFSLGKYLRGIIAGEWSGAALERRALGSELDASGSVTVPVHVSRDIWDRARNKALAFKAGAATIEMPGPKLILPRLTTDAAGNWKPENADATDTTMTFDGFELQARTLMFWMETSQELLQDAGLLESQIRNSFAEAAALELDRATIMGSGTGEEPQGLYYNPDVTQTAVAGTAFDDCSDAIYRIEDANGESRTFAWSPRSANYLRKLKDGDGKYLEVPKWMPDQRLVSKQIPDNLGAGSDESIVVSGDFRNMIVGIRTPFKIGVTKEASAAKKYQAWIYGAVRADIAVMRPEHFEVITGVLSGWLT